VGDGAGRRRAAIEAQQRETMRDLAAVGLEPEHIATLLALPVEEVRAGLHGPQR
jgi:hypothetical protein